jgi:sec-independent protein translocase protein TatC
VDEARLPLVEHLAELRRRISWILVAWLVGAVVSWQFHTEIFGTLLRPAIAALAPDGGTLQAIAPTEIFFTYLKCALLAGFVGTLPVFFWQIWAFVSPGLYASEKKLVLPFVIASTLLFLAGASFGYFVVFPVMFEFFTGFEAEYVRSAWTMREVFGFTTRMFLAFGVAFELPILVLFLSLAGILSAGQLLRGTPYAILAIFVAAAILTPSPDWVSQVLLGVPMVGLYLLGVGVAWLFGRRKQAADAAQAAIQKV